MKHLILLMLCLPLALGATAQDVYASRNVSLSFFSKAPMEDIDAKTTQCVSAINIKTGAVYFKVAVNTFQFKKSLMQEHFNENYLETHKFPNAEFKGKLLDLPDLTKPGTYTVTVEGTLDMHGVKKTYREKGTLTVAVGSIAVSSTFKVRVADHNIKIPRLVVKNIAEVVDVTVSGKYAPAK
ncbi:YceI family protein [Chitinophaga horti]|uniref:YceI family protein n=1 Tax=Chitinophaga horti TaxID=2920382 RepID=A0ABY6J0M1_9BACT|nr:YceI family protein [Chitinophaga horti]UYQ93214.1 YceI family protein [Chitinophaga horti]